MTVMQHTQQPASQQHQYETQISELDQAVSSITGDGSGVVPGSSVAILNPSVGSNDNKLGVVIPQTNNMVDPNIKLESVGVGECNSMMTGSTHQQEAMQQQHQQPLTADDGQLVHNTSDDSAMLNHVLDAMLDCKLINEILNAETETEINFENVLNESTAAGPNGGPQQMPLQQQQLPQQQTVYMEQPLTKRMRYDDTSNIQQTQVQQQQQITHVNGQEIADFTVFPQQQQQQVQQGQPPQYAQYDGTPITNTLNLDGGQYHQTPIDPMQLQLLYQQQQTMDATATYAGTIVNTLNMTTVPQNQQQQQLYDPTTGLVDTKQILELCSNAGQEVNAGELVKAGDFVTIPEDVSQQFQLFNVPSLTDDMEAPQQQQQQQAQVTHHIVERHQYVMPGQGDEEQLIYAITTNNPVTNMSQQHQQQVLAEFLNQAASNYEQQQQQQQLQHQQIVTNQTLMLTDTAPSKTDLMFDDLLEFDYNLIETVKSLSSSGSSSTGGNLSIKSERDPSSTTSVTSNMPAACRYHEDFYFNVFFYAGIPRPLAINCFGLIKLPQDMATTFRKNLLTARKANNSLMSLGNCSLNGVVGQSSAAAGRFSNSTKQLPSYFTNLTNNSGGGSTNMGNEFSIGSITITNASSTANNVQQGSNNGSLQQQTSKSGGVGSLENNLGATNGGLVSATSPISSVTPRGRTKSASNVGNNFSGSSSSTSSSSSLTNIKHKSLTGACGANSRVTVGAICPYNAKTIIVSNSAAISSERNSKFIKRSLITKFQDVAKLANMQHQQFTPKKLTDILNGKRPSSSSNSNDSSTNLEMSSEAMAEKQARLNRVNRFYEKRRKLLSMSQHQQHNNRHSPYQTSSTLVTQLMKQRQPPQHYQQHQMQQPQQQKLLKQQLMRSFSDCGINSTTNNMAATDSSNVMRVFV